MHKVEKGLILLNYKDFDYIEVFNSYLVNNKLHASSIDVHEFINDNLLKIYNYNTTIFYMNLLNFGGFCDWKVKHDTSLSSIEYFITLGRGIPKDMMKFDYSFNGLQWVTFYRYIIL